MLDTPENNELTRYQKVKLHLKENKKMYLVGAGCLTAGYFLRPQVVNIVDAFNFKYKSPTETTIVNVLARRTCQNPIPVRDKLTGEIYGSIRRAAKVTGESLSSISKDAQNLQERFEELPDSVFA